MVRFRHTVTITQVHKCPILRCLLAFYVLTAGLGIISCTHPPPSPSDPAPSVPQVTQEPERDPNHELEAQLLETLKSAETLGQGNPLVLSSLHSLAVFYRERGEYEKAEFQYKRALVLKEQISGPNHPDVAIILRNYAALLREAERHSEAQNLSARAKAIQSKHSIRGGR